MGKTYNYVGEYVEPTYLDNSRHAERICHGQGTFTYPNGIKFVGKW